jgi:outer membrane protein assembly factor BamB
VAQDGRVIVGAAHGVTALEPATGREVWHYLRSDARMCGVTATDGLVVAVFSTGGRCDEAVALRADTGVRAWNRNVTFSPGVRLTSTPSHVLAVSATGVVDIDPVGDNIRWRYDAPKGCSFADVRAGTAGMAVLQRCPGGSLQLRLLDGVDGHALWTRDVAGAGSEQVRLAGADGLVTLLVGDRLRVFPPTTGPELPPVDLPAGGASAAPQETAAGGGVLVWARGTVLALDRTSGAVQWRAAAVGLPGVQLGNQEASGPADVVVPEQGAFVVRDVATGRETSRSSVSEVPAGGTVSVLGPTVVYRLADRVLAYR